MIDSWKQGRELTGVEKRDAIEMVYGVGRRSLNLSYEEKAVAYKFYRKKHSIEPIPDDITDEMLEGLKKRK